MPISIQGVEPIIICTSTYSYRKEAAPKVVSSQMKQLTHSKYHCQKEKMVVQGYCTTIFLFWSIAAFFSKLWASESHPTSRPTFGKPRSRKRRITRLFLGLTHLMVNTSNFVQQTKLSIVTCIYEQLALVLLLGCC